MNKLPYFIAEGDPSNADKIQANFSAIKIAIEAVSVSSLSPKGVYVAETAYIKGDMVSYQGSSYAAIGNTTGNLPTNTTYWVQVASMGNNGATGSTGAKGDQGDVGPANELSIGTVEKGAVASATITGTPPEQVLNLVLPQGDKGDQGDPGDEVELQKSATYIQWKYLSDLTWTDLVALADLKGDQGDTGTPIELQVTATHIQWKYTTDVSWTDLIALIDLKGDQGIQGEVGETGASIISAAFVGNDLVFTKDDTTTVTLVNAKIDLKGDQGEIGPDGPQGDPGLGVPAGGATGEVLIKKTGTDNDTEWKNLLSLIPNQTIINGCFRLNQEGYVSGAALASGAFGHDMWKGGASGGNYSFTQLASITQITIAADKSIIQVIENKNVIGGIYTLSWKGTAQARFGINSATPSGAYASSPITITGQTTGTVMSIEFNSGTLSEPVLAIGSLPLAFSIESFSELLAKCQRYLYIKNTSTNNDNFCVNDTWQVKNYTAYQFPVTMRTSPSVTVISGGQTGHHGTAPAVAGVDDSSVSFYWVGASYRNYQSLCYANFKADARI